MTDTSPDEATRRYAEQLAALLDGAGFPRMPARVLMALVTSPDGELTAEQIGQNLGISPAAVSGAVRYLRSVQVVRAASIPGTRRRSYTLAPKWYTITLSRSTMYGELQEMVGLLPPAIGPQTPAGQRVQEMADFYAYLSRRFPEILQEWIELKGAER